MSKTFIYTNVLIKYLEDFNGNYFLSICSSKTCRQHALEVVQKASLAVKDKKVDSEILKDGLLNSKKLWHVEILWLFRFFKLCDIGAYLKLLDATDARALSQDFAECFMTLFAYNDPSQFSDQIAQDFISLLSEFCEESKVKGHLIDAIYSILLSNLFDPSFGKACNIMELSLKDGNKSNISKFLYGFCDKTFLENVDDIESNLNFALSGFKGESYSDENLLPLYQATVHAMSQDHLLDYFSKLLGSHSLNWKRAYLFISEAVRSTELSLKHLILSMVEQSLTDFNAKLLYISIFLARVCCQQSSNSREKMTYMSWFSMTFSSTSKRPLHSNKRAQFFLNALTKILPVDAPCYTRAHIHNAVSVPSCCHLDLSEYLQAAKAHLASLNEAIEVGMFQEDDGKNDVDILITQFKNSKKIPNNFLANINFRRHYYEKEFLPKLLSKCQGPSSTHHAVIVKLESLGKISALTFRRHVDGCK